MLFVALLVNTHKSAFRIIHLQSRLNSWLLMAQEFFSVVKSERAKVGYAVCHVCKIYFVTTEHFIGNLLGNSKATAPLSEILTGKLKLSLNCAANSSACICRLKMLWERILLNINVVSEIHPSCF